MPIYNNSCLHTDTDDNYILSPKGLGQKTIWLLKEKVRQPNKIMTVVATPHPA
jgi:hypothetical protein